MSDQVLPTGTHMLTRKQTARVISGVQTNRESGLLFDPHRRSRSAELSKSIEAIVEALEEAENQIAPRQRKRTLKSQYRFNLAVEALVCNFLVVQITGEDRPLAIPRSNDAMRAGNSFRSEVYGAHFLDVLKLMEHPQVALIQSLTTGYRFAEKAQLSTITATPKLTRVLGSQPVGWSALERVGPVDPLVLHSKSETGKSEVNVYSDNARTKKLRREVQELNDWLRDLPIFFRPDHSTGNHDTFGQPIDPTRMIVRRIFNNGKWTEGGRLYDGYWETMRREDRFRMIRIGSETAGDGEPIANVDFGQLFPRLAYMQAKQQAPEGDLYDILGDGSNRAGYKKLINAVLFAERPLLHWPKETRRLFPPGTHLREQFALIAAKHQPISHLFGTGIGYRLMFIESTVLMEILKVLRHRGIPALPLHDSVLVAKSHAETAKRVMEEKLLEFLYHEVRAMVSIDFG